MAATSLRLRVRIDSVVWVEEVERFGSTRPARVAADRHGFARTSSAACAAASAGMRTTPTTAPTERRPRRPARSLRSSSTPRQGFGRRCRGRSRVSTCCPNRCDAVPAKRPKPIGCRRPASVPAGASMSGEPSRAGAFPFEARRLRVLEATVNQLAGELGGGAPPTLDRPAPVFGGGDLAAHLQVLVVHLVDHGVATTTKQLRLAVRDCFSPPRRGTWWPGSKDPRRVWRPRYPHHP